MIIPEYGRTLTPEEWRPVVDEMLEATHIIFTTHENSDGDGLGSQVALALALKALGKDVAIFNPTEVPPNYLFLKELHEINLFRDRDEESMQEFFLADLLVVLDANLHDRIGRLWPHVEFAREMSRLKVLCVDHHLEPEDFADITVCETYASSTGELVCDLVTALGCVLDSSCLLPKWLQLSMQLS